MTTVEAVKGRNSPFPELPEMRIRTIAICLIALAVAGYAFTDAWARIYERKAPQNFATALVPNGFAEARLAEAVLRSTVPQEPGQAAQPKVKPTAAQQKLVMDLSLDGYRREPFNAVALRNLGLVADFAGDKARARRLMQAAHDRTRRDLWAVGWLAADHALAGRTELALQSYDAALRSSTSAQAAILPIVLKTMEGDVSVEPIIELLKQGPPWQNEFWGLAPRFSGSLPNIAKVRVAMFEAKIDIPVAYDRVLVTELATHRHFAAAESIADRLHAGTERRRGEGFRNGDFRDAGEHFGPFGWELFFDSNISTELNTAAGQLIISTFSSGGGPAARQLIVLPRDAYTLSAKIADWDQMDKGALYFRLECAEAGDHPQSRQVPFDQPNVRISFEKPQSDCDYYWFTLYARPNEARQNNLIVLDDISLRSGGSDR
jgi:hypothetical protein